MVSLVLMTVDHRFHHLEAARSTLKWVISPLQHLVDLPFRIGSWASDALTTHDTLMVENRQLHRENLDLHVTLQQFESLTQENSRLRELLNASVRLQQKVVIAELLSVDLDPYKQEILINKGLSDGAYIGQPLLDANGIMGQIIRVDRLDATAMLISDPSHALPVQFDQTGLRTLAVGTGNPKVLELRHIPNSTDIPIGAIVRTSGLGGRFPADYPVARVTQVEHISGEPFARVQAQPLARLDRSREVLLVWPDTAEADKPAQNTPETSEKPAHE